MSRSELVEHLYDQDFDRDSNTIEVFVGRLRKKLGVDVIQTMRGLGYVVAAPEAGAARAGEAQPTIPGPSIPNAASSNPASRESANGAEQPVQDRVTFGPMRPCSPLT